MGFDAEEIEYLEGEAIAINRLLFLLGFSTKKGTGIWTLPQEEDSLEEDCGSVPSAHVISVDGNTTLSIKGDSGIYSAVLSKAKEEGIPLTAYLQDGRTYFHKPGNKGETQLGRFYGTLQEVKALERVLLSYTGFNIVGFHPGVEVRFVEGHEEKTLASRNLGDLEFCLEVEGIDNGRFRRLALRLAREEGLHIVYEVENRDGTQDLASLEYPLALVRDSPQRLLFPYKRKMQSLFLGK